MIDAARIGKVAQPLQGGAHQTAAAVAVVDETQLRVQCQPIVTDALLQRRHLAGDGDLLSLTIR